MAEISPKPIHARSKSTPSPRSSNTDTTAPLLPNSRSFLSERGARMTTNTTVDDGDDELMKTRGSWSDILAVCNPMEVLETIFPMMDSSVEDTDIPAQIEISEHEDIELSFDDDDFDPQLSVDQEDCAYQKRGRFLVWPVSLASPMGVPIQRTAH